MMNGVVRSIVRRSGSLILNCGANNSKRLLPLPAYSRAVWHMSARSPLAVHNSSFGELCSCGCRSQIHTNGEKELVSFLKEEIAAERQAQKLKTLPKELDGFAIKTEGAEITLTKKSDGETISISLNVNHSVDADVEPEIDPKADNPDLGDLKSKPNFEVDITRGGKTLTFTCSFAGTNEAESEDGYNDAFCIDEVSYFEGEWNDNTYAVAGDVLDGNLYDLFMTILEEKGISSEFADKLSEIATSFEHSSYIQMLENLSKFSSK